MAAKMDGNKAKLLKAIHDHKTTDKAKLRKLLKVGRSTLYRWFDEVNQEEINAALGVTVGMVLTPAQAQDFEVFKAIPTVAKFHDVLRYSREASEKYTLSVMRYVWRVSKILETHPDAITLKQVSDLLIEIKKGTVKKFGSGYDVRRAFRAWFGFRGFGSLQLTNEGIHARLPTPKNRERSHARFTKEQRQAIREAARRRFAENWQCKKVPSYGIPFKDEPNLAAAMDEWFEFVFYTMTRNQATLNTVWQIMYDGKGFKHGVNFVDEELVEIFVVDKGKRGGLQWTKRLIGQAARNFRAYYERIGQPKAGRVFPFDKNVLRYFLIECYKEAQVPAHLWRGATVHIWRHTGAQDLLDATNWNRAIVAAQGGWESEDVLKKHYGEVPPAKLITQVRKAMGLPVVEEKKEFVY